MTTTVLILAAVGCAQQPTDNARVADSEPAVTAVSNLPKVLEPSPRRLTSASSGCSPTAARTPRPTSRSTATAHLPDPPDRPTTATRSSPWTRDRGNQARLDRHGSHHLRLLPARRRVDRLRLDPPREPRLSAAARHEPRLRLADRSRAMTSSAPAPTEPVSSSSPTRRATTPRPRSRRTATRSSSPRCATATSTSTP